MKPGWSRFKIKLGKKWNSALKTGGVERCLFERPHTFLMQVCGPRLQLLSKHCRAFSDQFILNLQKSAPRKKVSRPFKGAGGLWHLLSDIHRSPHTGSSGFMFHLLLVSVVFWGHVLMLLIYFTLSSYFNLLSPSDSPNSSTLSCIPWSGTPEWEGVEKFNI